MSNLKEEIQSVQKRKADDSCSSPNSKKCIKEDDILPESPEQLKSLLIPIDYARQLLTASKSKWPLKKLRVLFEGSWMRYQAVRDRSKNPLTSFFIDRVFHVNRDGLRFRNTRENSYRSIIKLKECETPLDNDVFNLWLDDLSRWNVPVPSVAELKAKREAIEKAIEELKVDVQNDSNGTSEANKEENVKANSENQNDNSDQIKEKKNNAEENKNNCANTETIQSTSTEITLPEGLTKEDVSKMIITIDELCRLLEYGKDVFERVATGFFVEIRAPPNPNHKKINTDVKGLHVIYIDQIIGVNWVGKPYLIYQKPMTLSLKFRHFRDEKLKLLPFRDRKTALDQKAIDQWLHDTIEWEEEFPTKEFIEQKSEELKNVFSEPPKGPPIDLMKMIEGENSAKQLKRIMNWQKEQHDLVDRLRHPYPPQVAPYPGPYNRFQPPYSMQRPQPHRFYPPPTQRYPVGRPYPIPPLAQHYSHNQPRPYIHPQMQRPPMNHSYFPAANPTYPPVNPAYPRPLRTIPYASRPHHYW